MEDVLFDRREDATERMVEFAETVRGSGKKREVDLSWREAPVSERLSHALVNGIVDFEGDAFSHQETRPVSPEAATSIAAQIDLGTPPGCRL